MRSKPKNSSNVGKAVLVVVILGVIWLVVGTLFMLKVKDVIINGTYSVNTSEDTAEQDGDNGSGTVPDDPDDDEDEDEDDSWDDSDFDSDDDSWDDEGDGAGDSEDDTDDDVVTGDDDTDDDAVTEDGHDADDDDDDEDDGVETYTVNAWDGFAAVRTGRGTGYSQVGRLNNGKTVKVKNLKDGWYEIAAGKWKGYYLHKSSLK